ncbi:MAG: hypothetical protein R2813_00635 [Flavobacteriales bacterium]
MNNKQISHMQAMDMILSYCLEHASEPVSMAELQEHMLPGFDDELMRYLLDQIDEFNQKVVTVSLAYDGEFVQPNAETKSFVESGGFTAYYS